MLTQSVRGLLSFNKTDSTWSSTAVRESGCSLQSTHHEQVSRSRRNIMPRLDTLTEVPRLVHSIAILHVTHVRLSLEPQLSKGIFCPMGLVW